MSAATTIAATQGSFRSQRPRTGQPVHRNSYHAGEQEVRRWKADNTFGRDEHNARMRAAEELEHKTKLPGKRNGALGYVALKVLRFLLRLRGKKTGRLDPSHAWLAKQVHHAVSAVRSALARLKLHGFLDWVRRTQLVEDPEPGGQYVEQISNAYFFTLPRRAAEWVRRMLRRPTEAMRRSAEAREREARAAAMTAADYVRTGLSPTMAAAIVEARDDPGGANPLYGENGPCEAQG